MTNKAYSVVFFHFGTCCNQCNTSHSYVDKRALVVELEKDCLAEQVCVCVCV